MFSKLFPISILLILYKIQLSISNLNICEPGKNDIIFLVDTSTSIQDSCLPGQEIDNWSYIITFLKSVIEGLEFNTNPALRVGIIPFSSRVDPDFSVNLGSVKVDLLSKVDMLRGRYFGGNTNTSGALRQARYTFEQDRYGGRRKVVVLVTDGQSNVDESLTLVEAEVNRIANITHFVVAITPFVNRGELQSIINNDLAYYYFDVPNFENLRDFVTPVLEKINCPIPPKDGCSDVKADICFVLDSSGSIIQDDKKNYTDWNYMKQFLLDVVSKLKVGAEENRFALVEFSEKAVSIFHLDFSFDADVIKTKIFNLSFFGETTNTQAALTLMYREIFTTGNGDRPHAPNIGIVITDGKSNVNTNQTIPAANMAKSLGIRIFAVGLTSSVELSELNGIASHPKEQHVFTRNTIALVSTVVSNLIFNLCHGTCFTNCSSVSRCVDGYYLNWQIQRGKMITGYDYKKIDGVIDMTTCQNNCLQEETCMSIEFVERYHVCNLSRVIKSSLPSGQFVDDPDVEYAEWVCIKS